MAREKLSNITWSCAQNTVHHSKVDIMAKLLSVLPLTTEWMYDLFPSLPGSINWLDGALAFLVRKVLQKRGSCQRQILRARVVDFSWLEQIQESCHVFPRDVKRDCPDCQHVSKWEWRCKASTWRWRSTANFRDWRWYICLLEFGYRWAGWFIRLAFSFCMMSFCI